MIWLNLMGNQNMFDVLKKIGKPLKQILVIEHLHKAVEGPNQKRNYNTEQGRFYACQQTNQ